MSGRGRRTKGRSEEEGNQEERGGGGMRIKCTYQNKCECLKCLSSSTYRRKHALFLYMHVCFK